MDAAPPRGPRRRSARAFREFEPAEPFGGSDDAIGFAVDIISRLLPGSDPFVTGIHDGGVFLRRGPSDAVTSGRTGYVGIPLVDSGGQQIGSLCILDAEFPDADDQAVRRLLDAMGRTIVSEFEREEREQSLRALAEQDTLTGLLNRGSFEQVLGREWQRARDGEGDARLVLADVNDLKSVNDALGHQAGDQLLRDVADAIGEAARESDFVGRVGGDEFAVILVGADERGEGVFRDRLGAALAARSSARAAPSVALGGASLAESESADQAVARADRRMYRDKRRRFPPSR
jgi:diguanylate cyclase (GGDEF)-like protein